MTDNKIKCYGQYASRPLCKRCDYRKSCEYYTKSSVPSPRPRQEKVSYESIADWHMETADTSSIPGCGGEDGNEAVPLSMLGDFFRYLLNLDKYTLELLKAIFDDQRDEDDVPSVAELASRRGCSRQAVHRKILDIIHEHPELSRLFSLTLRHLPRDRRRYAGA